jgi:hypothetical protein
MRPFLPLLIALAVAGCSDSSADKPKRVRKPPAAPSVVSTITLPGSDGHVHILAVPGQYDVNKCLVHVGVNGVGSIACIPQADMAPLEYER